MAKLVKESVPYHICLVQTKEGQRLTSNMGVAPMGADDPTLHRRAHVNNVGWVDHMGLSRPISICQAGC